ncbi:flagellar hook-length control protein FliK [Roseibium aestuarii]|uniref:Flagellar hook-length control protein FliK n=1 Tax=Roseibium aestuarii TaxID=2600299 RepID=A0ABW4K011_9HYPH|nr:flagellar hook-length control protein FliK [Roseibium aestuarii]
MAGSPVELLQGARPVRSDAPRSRGEDPADQDPARSPFRSLLKSLTGGDGEAAVQADAPAAPTQAAVSEDADSLASLLASLAGQAGAAGSATAGLPGPGSAGGLLPGSAGTLDGTLAGRLEGALDGGEARMTAAHAGDVLTLTGAGAPAAADPASAASFTKGEGRMAGGAAAQGTASPQAQGAGQTPPQSGAASSPQTSTTAEESKANPFDAFAVEPEEVRAASRPGAADPDGELSRQIAGTIKVVRQETHFAPTLRLSPVQQIGEQIIDSLKGSSFLRSFDLPTRTEGPILKTLEIQLQPVELGSVKVQLRMVADRVEVVIQTAREATAEMLRQDQKLLDQMLKATGYKSDSVTIQVADSRMTGAAASATAQGGAADGSAQQNGFSGHTGGQWAGGSAGHSGEQAGRQDADGGADGPWSRSPDGSAADDIHEVSGRQGHETGSDRRAGGLYL